MSLQSHIGEPHTKTTLTLRKRDGSSECVLCGVCTCGEELAMFDRLSHADGC